MLLCLVVFLYPILFFGESLYYSDFAFITYPVKSFIAQTFQKGALPFWTHSIDSGAPFMGAFHTGVFYPPSILFVLPNTTLALNLFYAFHFTVLALSVYFLAASWNLTRQAALASALTALLGSLFLSSTMLSNWFLGVVWLPLIFFLYQQFILEKKVRFFVAATFALVCQILAASPELCILTILLLLPYSLVLIPRHNTSFSSYGRLGVMVVMILLALGISALQLVPTYKLVEHSLREGGLAFEVHAYRSMSFTQLSELILPVNFDNYFSGNGSGGRITTFFISIYMGLIPFVLLIVAIHFRQHRAIQFWLWVFLTGIFFASGAHNPIYEWFYTWMPLMSLFRFPEKFFNLSAFALVFLTGHVLDRLIIETQKKNIKWTAVIGPLTLVLGLVITLGWVQPEKNPAGAVIILMIFGGLYLLFYFEKLKPLLFCASVILLLGLDLAVQGYKVVPTVDNAFYETPPQLLASLQKDETSFRVYTGKIHNPIFKGFPNEPGIEAGYYAAREHMYPYFGMIFGVEYPNGLLGIGLELKNPRIWNDWYKKSSPAQRLRILERSNVKYWIDGDRPTLFAKNRPVILPERLKKLRSPLPRAFLVPAMKRVEPNRLFSTYYDESFDPLSEVLLTESVNFKPSSRFTGQVEQVKYQPNQVAVTTRQEGNGFLVLLDSYFPGWTVKVDGNEQPILRANHFYRAVQLSPGKHTLEFEYSPEGFKLGLLISVVSGVLLIVVCLILRRYLKTSAGLVHEGK